MHICVSWAFKYARVLIYKLQVSFKFLNSTRLWCFIFLRIINSNLCCTTLNFTHVYPACFTHYKRTLAFADRFLNECRVWLWLKLTRLCIACVTHYLGLLHEFEVVRKIVYLQHTITNYLPRCFHQFICFLFTRFMNTQGLCAYG